MNQEDNKKKLSQQIVSLRSSNRSAILETLKELRSEGDVSVLPELFNLMLIQEDEEVLDELAKFLNDLKDKDAAEVMARAVANPEYEKIQTSLVAACWQNGLPYGEYISTFVDVVVSGDYSAAIEAFTVIEEAVGDLEQEERAALALSLKSRLQQVEEKKLSLFVELVKIIESY